MSKGIGNFKYDFSKSEINDAFELLASKVGDARAEGFMLMHKDMDMLTYGFKDKLTRSYVYLNFVTGKLSRFDELS